MGSDQLERPAASSYARRVLSAGAACVVALAIAALATNGSVAHVRGSGVRANARLPNSLAIAIVALMAVVACGALYVLVTRRARGEVRRIEGSRPRLAVRALAACVPLFVLGVFAFVALSPKHRVGARRDRARQVSAPVRRSRPQPQARSPTGPSIWPPLVVLVLLAGAGGAAVFMPRRRERGPLQPMRRRDSPPPDPESLADPAAIAEPRAAVVAAFARLEAELARAGLRRREGEGPMEFTERVSAARPALGRPVRALARAYAPARFSEHPVDAGTRRDALLALDAVRHELAAEPVA